MAYNRCVQSAMKKVKKLKGTEMNECRAYLRLC